jgi:signal transduction histidine kinase
MVRAVLAGMPDPICLADLDGTILVLNPAAERILDAAGVHEAASVYGLVEVLAKRLTDLDALAGALLSVHADPLCVLRGDVQLRGSGRVVSYYSAPLQLPADQGLAFGRLFVLRDVTAERQMACAVDQFVESASHALRTPLTTIVGYLEGLLCDAFGELAPDQRRALEIVERNTTRLLEVAALLLTLAQADAGRPASQQAGLAPLPAALEEPGLALPPPPHAA